MSGGYESGGFESGGYESGGKRVMHRRKKHTRTCGCGECGGGFFSDIGNSLKEVGKSLAGDVSKRLISTHQALHHKHFARKQPIQSKLQKIYFGKKKPAYRKRPAHHKRPYRGRGGIYSGTDDEDFEGGNFLDDLEDFGHGFVQGLQGVAQVAAPIAQLAAQYGGARLVHPMHHMMKEHVMHHKMHPGHMMHPHMGMLPHHMRDRGHPMHVMGRMHHGGSLADQFDALALTDGGYMSGGKRRTTKKKTTKKTAVKKALKKMTKAEMEKLLMKSM